MYPANRFVRNSIYQMKRQFGVPATVYLETAVHDLQTGVRTPTVAKYDIRLAVVLPDDWKRKFAYDLSYVAANKNFTYGGFFDVGTRQIMIDKSDLPKDLVITLDHHMTVGKQKYRLVDAQDIVENGCWIVSVKAVLGEQAHRVLDRVGQDRITLEDSGDVTT